MASEEEVLCVDSSYETIDVIDLTKESPKMRPLRSRLRQHNLSTVYNNRSSSLKAHQRLSCLNSPLTLGTQDSAICCDNTYVKLAYFLAIHVCKKIVLIL